MSRRELQIWNGCAIAVMPHEYRNCHIYIAAYSRADARRLLSELGLRDPGDYAIKMYWSHGSWGLAMNGVEIERGVWVSKSTFQKPERWTGRG